MVFCLFKKNHGSHGSNMIITQIEFNIKKPIKVARHYGDGW